MMRETIETRFRGQIPPPLAHELKRPRLTVGQVIGKACVVVLVVVAYLAFAFIVAVWLVPAPKARADEFQTRKAWFDALRPNPNSNAAKRGWESCCGIGDAVKARFKVERAADGWSEQWFAQKEGSDVWEPIPPEIVLDTPSIDGQGWLFETSLLPERKACFVKPTGKF